MKMYIVFIRMFAGKIVFENKSSSTNYELKKLVCKFQFKTRRPGLNIIENEFVSMI